MGFDSRERPRASAGGDEPTAEADRPQSAPSGTTAAWIDSRGSTGRVIPGDGSARDRDNLSSQGSPAAGRGSPASGACERRDAKVPSDQLGFFTSSSISLKKSSSLGFFLGLGASLKCSGTTSS